MLLEDTQRPSSLEIKMSKKEWQENGKSLSYLSFHFYLPFSSHFISFRLTVDFTAHMDCVLHWFMNYSFLLALFSMNQFTKVVLCSRITLTSSILYCRDRFHFSYRYVPFFLSLMFSVNWLNRFIKPV